MARRLRLWSGLILFVFVGTHLLNHALGVISLGAAEAGRFVFMTIWRNSVGSLLLYGALITHIALVLMALYQARHLRLPRWEIVRLALGLAMPLTMVGIAVPTHFLTGLDWTTSFLIGAILSPTDPVFASAIVGRTDVPLRLRRLLNVESGLNDGLALPFVLIFLATAANRNTDFATIAVELVLGLAVGIVIPAVIALAWRLKALTAEPRLQALGPLAIAVILVFLVSFRATGIVAVAIPLSIVATFILLYFSGQTLNVFTLGGLALGVGRLVDDSIVELENIHRHLALTDNREKAVLDAAQEVAMPILVSTITTVPTSPPAT